MENVLFLLDKVLKCALIQILDLLMREILQSSAWNDLLDSETHDRGSWDVVLDACDLLDGEGCLGCVGERARLLQLHDLVEVALRDAEADGARQRQRRRQHRLLHRQSLVAEDLVAEDLSGSEQELLALRRVVLDLDLAADDEVDGVVWVQARVDRASIRHKRELLHVWQQLLEPVFRHVSEDMRGLQRLDRLVAEHALDEVARLVRTERGKLAEEAAGIVQNVIQRREHEAPKHSAGRHHQNDLVVLCLMFKVLLLGNGSTKELNRQRK
mmetsp:Transcript_7905/g.18638  ORF Transcript_7905/g.18638 Transcript_7905/m.18638 type:complete len:270 (+) Transcript_7905:1573-2382(+)